MAHDANVVQVEIFGQTYNLRADGDPTYVQSLAAYVDSKMREVARETKAVDTLRVAILTALNIADESRRNTPAAPASPTDAATPSNGKAAQRAKEAKSAEAAKADLDRRAVEWVKILDEALAG